MAYMVCAAGRDNAKGKLLVNTTVPETLAHVCADNLLTLGHVDAPCWLSVRLQPQAEADAR